MPFLCTNCIKHSELLNLLEREGKQIAQCDTCSGTNVKALSAESQSLKCLFRSLIRYYFSEWQYSEELVEDSVESLFATENPILSDAASRNMAQLILAVSAILEDPWQNPETGVSLYAGYDDWGERRERLVAIKEDFDRSLTEIDYFLQGDNYFALEAKAREKFDEMVSAIESKIAEGSEFYRARIGVKSIATPKASRYQDWHCNPYAGLEIGAPPPPQARPGRMNRAEVSYLYVASSPETAIAEVRPHPGQYVSFGMFRCPKELSIADLSQVSISRYCTCDRDLEKFLYLKSIEKLFALPISPDVRKRYMFTQFLADLFRHNGFEGVSYRSSLSSGVNLAFFNQRCLTYVEGSAEAVKVSGVSLAYQSEPLIDSSVEYVRNLNDGSYFERNYLLRISAE